MFFFFKSIESLPRARSVFSFKNNFLVDNQVGLKKYELYAHFYCFVTFFYTNIFSRPVYIVTIEINMCLVIYVPASLSSFLCSRMLVKGYKQPLEEKDLWSLNRGDCSEHVVPQLVHYWNTECEKVKRSGAWQRHTVTYFQRYLV